MARPPSHLIARKALALVAVPLVFHLVFLLVIRSLAHWRDVEDARALHTQETLARANRLLRHVVDAETAVRGFVITQDQAFVEPFDRVSARLSVEAEELVRHVGDDPGQHQGAKRIQQLVERKHALTRELRALADQGRHDEVVTRIRSRAGHLAMEELRREMAAFTRQEALLDRERREASAAARESIRRALMLGAFVDVALALAIIGYVSRRLARRLGIVADNTTRVSRGEPLHARQGGTDEIAQLDAVMHDMAEAVAESSRKEREGAAEARQAHARLDAILESMGEGLYQLDSSARLVYLNRAGERILGYELEQVRGVNMHELIHSRHPDGTARPAESCPLLAVMVRGETHQETEDWFQRQDGTFVPVQYTSAPLFREGDVTGAVLTFRDVSERREVERLKAEFVSTVSHELRTPLTSIRGSLSLLSAGALGELPAEAREVLEIAERNTLRLVDLINDILDLEKLGAGLVELELRPLAASAVLQRAAEVVGALADHDGIVLLVEPSDASVIGDPERLVQVVVNLLSNAVKFSSRGGDVRLSASRRKGMVRFEVADHGRGIAPEQQALVFERFRQVEASDAREKGGSGLGLAICKAIVEQHGGRIGVESHLGQGSTFWFDIPAG